MIVFFKSRFEKLQHYSLDGYSVFIIHYPPPFGGARSDVGIAPYGRAHTVRPYGCSGGGCLAKRSPSLVAPFSG